MVTVEKHKVDMETPRLFLDMDVLERNIQKMQAATEGAGKYLRPHVKTNKSFALARRQIEGGAIGVCVAKVSSVQQKFERGI